MAQALGADLAHMDATEVAILHRPPADSCAASSSTGAVSAMSPKTRTPGRIGQLTLYHQNNTAYLIIDGDAQEEAMAVDRRTQFMMRPPTWVVRDGRRTRDRDRPARRVVAGHGQRLQRRRRARRGSAAAQETGMAEADRHHPSARSICGPAPADSRWAACRPRWTPRFCTSTANRSPASSRRAAHGGLAAWGYASGISLGDGSFYGRRAGRAAAKG